MSELKSNERLALISEKIDIIFEICKGGVAKALDDKKLARPAILMHLVACNEQLQKLQDNAENKALSVFEPEQIRGLRCVRNVTAHDYEGINLDIIENVIRNYLPSIKLNIDNFLSNQNNS